MDYACTFACPIEIGGGGGGGDCSSNIRGCPSEKPILQLYIG